MIMNTQKGLPPKQVAKRLAGLRRFRKHTIDYYNNVLENQEKTKRRRTGVKRSRGRE
jgi:transposase-like protein